MVRTIYRYQMLQEQSPIRALRIPDIGPDTC